MIGTMEAFAPLVTMLKEALLHLDPLVSPFKWRTSSILQQTSPVKLQLRHKQVQVTHQQQKHF